MTERVATEPNARVTIVVLNWNGWADTLECLESVFRISHDHISVIVCDNASADSSLERIKAWADGALDVVVGDGPLKSLTHPRVTKPIRYVEYAAGDDVVNGDDAPLTLIQTGANLGYAGGNNVALRYALAKDGFDYVWILNNDTVVRPDALSALLTTAQSDPSIGFCGSTSLLYDEPTRIDALGGGTLNRITGLVTIAGNKQIFEPDVDEKAISRTLDYIKGSSLLASKRFLLDVGLMSEEYFLYMEELDWAMRARGLHRLAYCRDSIVYHKVGRSVGTSVAIGKRSLVSEYYAKRSGPLFMKKFFPLTYPIAYLRVLCIGLFRLCFGPRSNGIVIFRALLSMGPSPENAKRQ